MTNNVTRSCSCGRPRIADDRPALSAQCGAFDDDHSPPASLPEPRPPIAHAAAHALPRGYGPLADQMRRALLGAYLNLTEAAARDGNDRRQRFRCTRGECNEAAAADASLLWRVPHMDIL
jgi:hypothetical protein